MTTSCREWLFVSLWEGNILFIMFRPAESGDIAIPDLHTQTHKHTGFLKLKPKY